MTKQPISGTIFFICISLLAACSTNPTREGGHGEFVPFTEKPGDVRFGSPEADLIYEILVGEIATQRGQPEVAATFYLDAAKISRDAEIAARAARIAGFAKQKEIALEAAKIWSEQDPENLEATRILAMFYIRNNRSEDAKAHIQRLLNSDPERIQRSILHIGAMLQRDASEQTAVEVSEFISQEYPQYAETHYVHASLLLGIDEQAQALIAVEKSLAIKNDWIDAITLRSRILLQLGRNDEALEYLGKFLKANPNEDEARLTYARALVDVRRLKDARGQFELLAVKMPDNEDVLFTLAMLSMQFKDLDEADGYLRQLYKLGKSSSQIIYYLGQIAEQKENDAEALNWYKKIRTGEYFLDAQLRIASVMARTNSLEEALEHIHALEIRTKEDKREVLLFEGSLLKNAKQYKKAYKLYSKGLKEFPEDIDIIYSRALIGERLNLIDEVISDLNFVLEKEPNNAAAHNALGYTLADRTDRLDDALMHVKRAMELEPEDPAIIDSMGWVYFRMGNFEKAVEYLEQAYTLIQDGEVAAHYGEALYMAGQEEKAKKIWGEAKEAFGDNEILLQTMERFGN